MQQEDVLQQKLNQSLELIREAVDVSTELMATNSQGGNTVTARWENFLKQFFVYVKQKSNETGKNLIAGISWSKIKP